MKTVLAILLLLVLFLGVFPWFLIFSIQILINPDIEHTLLAHLFAVFWAATIFVDYVKIRITKRS